MSKAPKNIEKILLGSAVVVAAGFTALGFMKSSAAEEEFTAPIEGKRGNETAVADAELVPETMNSLELDRTIEAGQVDTTKLAEGTRPVDSFTGVPLYANRDNPLEPVDPIESQIIHPPIPNVWWIKYGISPNFADSPQRDPDGDGFANAEEFQGETDPSDIKSHPPLVAKLMYVKDESFEWFVEFGFEAQDQWIPKFKGQGGLKNRVDFAAGLAPGDLFFAGEPFDNRFKFIRIEDRAIRNERLNIDEKLRFAIFEDQKPNKLGLQYETPNRLPKAEAAKFFQYDRTAVFDLQAIGMAGQEFKVEERTKFALPPEGEDKIYYLAELTPDKAVVEWGEGDDKRTVEIPRGGLPEMDLKPR